MSERIKLTDYFEIIEFDGVYFLHGKQEYDMGKKEAKRLLKQILDDNRIVENLKERAVPFLKNILSEQDFGRFKILFDDESMKLLTYLVSDEK